MSRKEAIERILKRFRKSEDMMSVQETYSEAASASSWFGKEPDGMTKMQRYRWRKAKAKALRKPLTYGFTFGGMPLRCGLCRVPRGTPQAFSKDRQICKSCSMRGEIPRYVQLDCRVIAWRNGKTIPGLPNRFDSRVRATARSSQRIADALVASRDIHNNLSLILKEWPLILVLADDNTVYELRKQIDEQYGTEDI